MNRRRFLELLGTATLGSGIVYSFPSIIVPNITLPQTADWLEFYRQQILQSKDWFNSHWATESMWVTPPLHWVTVEYQ